MIVLRKIDSYLPLFNKFNKKWCLNIIILIIIVNWLNYNHQIVSHFISLRVIVLAKINKSFFSTRISLSRIYLYDSSSFISNSFANWIKFLLAYIGIRLCFFSTKRDIRQWWTYDAITLPILRYIYFDLCLIICVHIYLYWTCISVSYRNRNDRELHEVYRQLGAYGEQ